jgi:GTP cyclohydrolase II
MGIITRNKLPLDNGAVPEIITFDNFEEDDGRDHFALIFGQTSPAETSPLVRVHSECVTGDVLGSLRCDCGKQLDESLERLSHEGGILIYLRQEGRGIGLREKLKAYRLQEQGLDTFQANLALGHAEDSRRYEIAAMILMTLGIKRIRLLTRNHHKAVALCHCGIAVDEVVPTGIYSNDFNKRYLEAKEMRNASSLGEIQRHENVDIESCT